ncbi:MAG: LptE family protein [Deltaproteobacteria bacterium]|nr:LptE family protein [Deltaproteobacteria bacterium]
MEPYFQKTQLLIATLLLILCATMMSCGYRFSTQASLAGNVKRLCIATLENRTAISGLETIMTNDLIYEFTRSGSAAITDKKTADAVLTGTIRSATSETISHQSSHTSLERRITMVMDLRMTGKDGKIYWAENGLSDFEEYRMASDKLSTDKLATEQNIKSAVKTLSKRLAQRIYYQMTNNF